MILFNNSVGEHRESTYIKTHRKNTRPQMHADPAIVPNKAASPPHPTRQHALPLSSGLRDAPLAYRDSGRPGSPYHIHWHQNMNKLLFPPTHTPSRCPPTDTTHRTILIHLQSSGDIRGHRTRAPSCTLSLAPSSPCTLRKTRACHRHHNCSCSLCPVVHLCDTAARIRRAHKARSVAGTYATPRLPDVPRPRHPPTPPLPRREPFSHHDGAHLRASTTSAPSTHVSIAKLRARARTRAQARPGTTFAWPPRAPSGRCRRGARPPRAARCAAGPPSARLRAAAPAGTRGPAWQASAAAGAERGTPSAADCHAARAGGRRGSGIFLRQRGTAAALLAPRRAQRGVRALHSRVVLRRGGHRLLHVLVHLRTRARQHAGAAHQNGNAHPERPVSAP